MDQFEAIAYFVRSGPNEELRFSLRSVAKAYPDLPVFIVGDKPDWCHPDGFLPGNHWANKPLNVWGNLTLLAGWDQLPDRILVMMDDLYITGPVKDIPVLYRGALTEHLELVAHRSDEWAQSLRKTAEELPPEALSYELHTPFPCSRVLLNDTLAREPGAVPPQWRTLYGNTHHVNPTRADDVKITNTRPAIPPGPFISTTDMSWRWVKHHLQRALPTPSPWET